MRFTFGVHAAAPDVRVLRPRVVKWTRYKLGYPQHLQPPPEVAPRLSRVRRDVFHNRESVLDHPIPRGKEGGQLADGVTSTAVACFPQEAGVTGVAGRTGTTSGSQEESKTG